MQNQAQLSPKCQYFLDRFVKQANKNAPFPTDWELFYDFVRVCHDEECPVAWQDLYMVLINLGFPQNAAQPLSNFYKQGRALLERPEGYDQAPQA